MRWNFLSIKKISDRDILPQIHHRSYIGQKELLWSNQLALWSVLIYRAQYTSSGTEKQEKKKA